MVIPLNANRESLFRRLIAKAFSPAVRQATVVLFDQGFCSVANFLTGVLVARACIKAEYGLFIIGLTLMRFIIGIHNSVVSIPYTIQSPHFKDRKRAAYFGSTLLHQLGICVLSTLGILLCSVIVSATGRNDELARILMALSVAAIALLMQEFMRFVFLAELRFWASFVMGFIASVATITSMFVAYFAGNLSAPKAFLIMACCSGMPAIVAVLSHRKQLIILKNHVIDDLKINWKLGKWLVAKTLVYMPAVQIYPFALAAILDAEKAAVYGACLTLASLMNPLFIGIANYLRPKASHAAVKKASSIRRIIYSGLVVVIIPLMALLIGAIFFGNTALVIFFGSKYYGLGSVLVLCVLAISVFVINTIISVGIESLGKTDISFKGRTIGAVVSLVIGLPLVCIAGPSGAAIGLLFSHILTGLYWWKQFEKLTLKYRKLIYARR